MVFLARKKWSVITILLFLFKHLKSQIPMMGVPGPPMFAMAPPAHMVAMPFPIVIKKVTTTTTTTEKSRLAFAVPVPMPMPMPFGMLMPPPALPPSCPKPGVNVAMFPPPPPPPMGMPMPPPPPVVVVPFPPYPRIRRFRPYGYKRPYSSESMSLKSSGSYGESSCSGSSCSSESSSSDWSYRRKRRRRRKLVKRNKQNNFDRKGKVRRKGKGKGKDKKYKKLIGRRIFDDDSSFSGNEFVKPVLTYMSKNGNVKIKKQISHDQAEHLINDNEPKNNNRNRGQKVQITSRKNAEDPSRVLVVSSSDGEYQPETRRQVVLRNGASSHILGEGKKQLVFKPPDFMKISNLSVSFHVV